MPANQLWVNDEIVDQFTGQGHKIVGVRFSFSGHVYSTCEDGVKYVHRKTEIVQIVPSPERDDTWSSASRQHFIETGRYLTVAEQREA